MTLSVQRRRARGVTVQGNYTWSHCIDGGYADIAFKHRRSNIHELSAGGFNRGNCELDRRHNFNMSTVYETPQFSNTTLRILGTGWRVSGIVRLLSGPALNVTSGVDQALSGNDGSKAQPDACRSLYAANKSVDLWLNPAAFAMPAVGTYGNVGSRECSWTGKYSDRYGPDENVPCSRRTVGGIPGRSVQPSEPRESRRSRLHSEQVRPSAGFWTPRDPRIMQLALKFVF